MLIYKTTNLINGKIYVGKQNSSYIHNYYLGSGKILNQAIRKYGKENFKKEILEICKTKEQLNEREKFWIKELKSKDNKIGYNITEGGTGGKTYSKQSENYEEIRAKKSNSMKGKNKGNNNAATQENIKKKISNSMKKRWKNKEYRENQIKACTGRTMPKKTKEQKQKISNSIKEWWKEKKRQ